MHFRKKISEKSQTRQLHTCFSYFLVLLSLLRNVHIFYNVIGKRLFLNNFFFDEEIYRQNTIDF